MGPGLSVARCISVMVAAALAGLAPSTLVPDNSSPQFRGLCASLVADGYSVDLGSARSNRSASSETAYHPPASSPKTAAQQRLPSPTARRCPSITAKPGSLPWDFGGLY